MPSADVDDRGPAILGQCDTSGIVEIRKTVEELDAPAFAFQTQNHLIQRLRYDAVGIDLNLLDVGLIGGEDRQRTDVGRCFGEDDISWIDEELGDNVNGLLRTGGDDDILGVGVDAFELHDLGNLLTQTRKSLPVTVLKRSSPILADHRAVASASRSRGKSLRLGIPPARETTSGRAATAKSDRVSEARKPWARAA